MPRKREWYKVPVSTLYGEALRAERERQGLTQVALAARVEEILYPDGDGEFRQGVISAYETGKVKHPEPSIALAIDQALGLEPGTLSDLAGYGRGGRRRVQQAAPPQGSIVIPPTDPKLISLIEIIQERVEEDELETLGQLIEFGADHWHPIVTARDMQERRSADAADHSGERGKPTAVTKQAGTWTYGDLFSLPDDGRRYEIIEGELYEMPAPGMDHALTVTNLLLLLGPLVAARGGWLFTAPLDVFFQGADPVQPDIVILLPDGLAHPRNRGVEGPPDLVVEVVIPSSRGHDLLTKRALYARAGVREYWIVNPANRTVDILSLDRDAFHTAQIASGDDEVISLLLGNATFPLPAIFARLDEIKD